jgi:hypothetical protein
MPEKISKTIGSVVRTGVAALGGYLVAKGVISAETASATADATAAALTPLITGVVMWAIAQLWSLAQKKVFPSREPSR